MQTQPTVNKDVKVAALNELKKFIKGNNIDMSTYRCADGSIDLKALLQDYNINL